jgi:hypothetical protein
MWEIFRAELRYNRFAYFLLFAAIVLITLFQVVGTGGERLYVHWFAVVMALNIWNAKRIRENRDFLLALIPVSHSDVGKARALMLVLVPAAAIVLYKLLAGTLGPGAARLTHLGFVYGLTVLLFALLFMFRDRYVGTKNLMRGKVALIIILAILFGAGIVIMIMTDDAAESGAEPPSFLRVFDLILKNKPFGNPLYMACFVAGSLLIAYLSVITFKRRKTNVQI